MIKSRKSQMPSQMFTYIFTLLVIGLLLFFGVKAIGYLIGIFGDVTMVESKKSIENSFDNIKSNYKSWGNKKFPVPSEVDRVCFLDKSMNETEIQDTDICTSQTNAYDPLICDAWKAQEQAVVFDPIDAMEASIDVQDVKVDSPGYLCVNNTNGQIKVKLTGQGNAVKVSRA